ncbi:MAG TPA: DUF1707 domain-containing protein [Acidimicrobiales bacterium]|nr:DUF1707 domain-containing protein [Acidimicrobiales bacterium]
MSTPPPTPPPWAWRYDNARRPSGNAHLRVSDAERAAVGDVLSRHYADGRLDDAEFKERLDRAMSAKTRSDLAGLTTDLPSFEAPNPPPVPRHRHWRLVGLVLVAVLVISGISSLLSFSHLPWLLLAIVALLLWRRLTWRSFHHHHHHSHPAAPPFG